MPYCHLPLGKQWLIAWLQQWWAAAIVHKRNKHTLQYSKHANKQILMWRGPGKCTAATFHQCNPTSVQHGNNTHWQHYTGTTLQWGNTMQALHNSIQATTLWLLAGYTAPVTGKQFRQARSCARASVQHFKYCPCHQATNAWLGLSICNMVQASAYMHYYWQVTFNCGKAAKVRLPAQHIAVLQELVNSISSMP